jgi:hypothetical protein
MAVPQAATMRVFNGVAILDEVPPLPSAGISGVPGSAGLSPAGLARQNTAGGTAALEFAYHNA